MQSPGAEVPPLLPEDQIKTKEEIKDETVQKTEEVSPEKLPDRPEEVVEVTKPLPPEVAPAPVPVPAPTPALVEIPAAPVVTEVESVKEEKTEKPAVLEQKETKPAETCTVNEETPVKADVGELSDQAEPEIDMSGNYSSICRAVEILLNIMLIK